MNITNKCLFSLRLFWIKIIINKIKNKEKEIKKLNKRDNNINVTIIGITKYLEKSLIK